MAPQEKGVTQNGLAFTQTAQPLPEQTIVISGLAGQFPRSENVSQFRDNLFNKVDMVTDDNGRWKLEHLGIPCRTGKLLDVAKFDASFFGIHYNQAHVMDPLCRMLLERTYEAIVDAGINPRLLEGKRVGVIFGTSFSESERTWLLENKQENNVFAITGCNRAMFPNRISYWLGINGPSYTVDTACSASLYAIEHGYRAIRDGLCDAAIVGGSNLCLHPYISLQFSRLGILSPEGKCRCFDKDANGYARSEAICVVFLQKASEAKRIYARIVNVKTNCDGYKEQGITYPSGAAHKELLEKVYEECAVNPATVDYVEAHGTGTKVGDPEEVNTLDKMFCKNRKTPLPIGSVKSNMGHGEPVSGLCGVTKVIIAMETGFVPPNLHFNSCKDLPGLKAGRIKVVSEKYPLDCGLVGISSFGYGGANAHLLLQWNDKHKINGGAPADCLPRLVVASGRTEEAVDVILKEFESRPVDAEFVSLMQDIQAEEIVGHVYRGYTILTQHEKKLRNIQYCPGSKRPVWFVFTGMGSQWTGMGKSLLNIPIFAAAIEKCQRVLEPYGVDLFNIITTADPSVFDDAVNCLVGVVACQVGLVDVMRAVDIMPDGFVGVSVGELGCSYLDGCLTAEQTVLAAYWCGRALKETELSKGMMAAVGLEKEKTRKLCPPDIDVACHFGPNLCAISGPEHSVRRFLTILKKEDVYVEEIESSSIACHSSHIAKAGPAVLKYLEQSIPHSKPRSPKWVSSSVPQSAWSTPLATHSPAQYHTNNLLSPVLFQEASRHIPANAITIEIAPHGLLQAILHRSLAKTITNIALTQRGHPDCTEFLLVALGKLFEIGLQPKLTNLYPSVKYPVSRGTPMISPLVRWDHSEDWHVSLFRKQENFMSSDRCVSISLEDGNFNYLSGHVIDGRNLFPAMGYIELVWTSLGLMVGQIHTKVVFENVRFHRATNIPKEGSIKFFITVQKGSGKFEVVESGVEVVTGLVRIPEGNDDEMVPLPLYEQSFGNDLTELNSHDIYKELRLRGYNYQRIFRSLVSVDGHVKMGKIRWCSNWVAFMDNIMQTQILTEDTRGLFVPTSLEKLTIDPQKHAADLKALMSESEEAVLPVHVCHELGIVRSGGVELRGLKASGISRRKPLGTPVLEKYMFVPNAEPAGLDLHTALRVCMHITLENQTDIQVKAVELHKSGREPLSPVLALVLGDLPLIQAKLTLLANAEDPLINKLEITGFKVEDRHLMSEQKCTLIIASDVLSQPDLLQTALRALAEGGCILSREKSCAEITDYCSFKLEVVFEKTLEDEKLVLLKKAATVERMVTIYVSEGNYEWLPQLQAVVRNSAKQRVILVAQDEHLNGILGLVNCVRKEPGGERVTCVFIMDPSAPAFDVNLPFYSQQLKKNLAVNVFNNGEWGSYRHLPLDAVVTVSVPHAYVNALTRGDLSSMKWIQGGLDPNNVSVEPNEELVHIYYSSLNFRDVMFATGKLIAELGTSRLKEDCFLGLEFSGRDRRGQRVMGITNSGALASMVVADKDFLWDIPEHWTLEDAATVPVVYGTAYYALVMKGRIRKGESVLIHAGSGGVGQAALNICLHLGCTVFTTVGTEEKREFIKKNFPQLSDRNIGNSRDTSFEQHIMLETNGRGVDIVLNSLAEEKLQASVRCLARGGRFLEIGKFDLKNNNPLGMEMFSEQRTFHGVMLDLLLQRCSNVDKEKLHAILREGIKSGAVKPLTRTIFPVTEVEQAFRFMAAGKHKGKVMLQIRPEEENRKLVLPSQLFLQASPRYFCNPHCSYVIVGGLGGFGLELVDWLVLRGARKLVLNSRSGPKTGYQSFRVRTWRSYGSTVVISRVDITTKEGVKTLLSEANRLGPVDAIFNLAVVLRDALLENQTEEDFVASAKPKAHATLYLDELSREMCPQLRHFVVFSSVSCGRGNAGQTNYGMSNSIMERICEARVRDGFPGLAVQWGAVGEVGLVAEMQEKNTEIVIGGTLPQKISSCLQELDGFMQQSCPVVASMVVAEKRADSEGASNVVTCVSNILGVRDLKSINVHSTLSELGMDSLMAVEVKQAIERECETFLTTQEVHNLTFAHLIEINAAIEEGHATETLPCEAVKKPASVVPVTFNRDSNENLHLLQRVIGDEVTAAQHLVRLQSATGTQSDIEEEVKAGPVLFMVPGVEGMACVLEPLAHNLNYQTFCLQLGYSNMDSSIQDMAKYFLPFISSRLLPGASFNLLGYSFGGLLAMEIALELENQGRKGHLFLVDSSPNFVKRLQELTAGCKEDELESNVIKTLTSLQAPSETTPAEITKVMEEIRIMQSWNEKVERLLMMLPTTQYSKQHQKMVYTSMCARLKAVRNYSWTHKKRVRSHTVLIRPTSVVLNTEEDYGLSQYCEKVEVHFVKGNHITILDNENTAELINKWVTEPTVQVLKNYTALDKSCAFIEPENPWKNYVAP
ncbi:fatty acid synthase-like [Periplaneta americana]|uniref:fatty acid synthase-like n=1 Tax=Periplaneta americana TaxID=6978 RepID=UPI0037E9BE50